MALCFLFSAATSADAETRTLKLFFIHTKEKAEITYKRNGRYDQGGLTKINRLLRDWRRNEPTKMDPRLLDLVWEAYRQSGGRDYIHVVSAYRSPATNSMLRKRSKGVANKSQHMLGKAMDFYVPGVKLARLRAAALKLQGGGVGYYPSSGSPFVHMDVGNVRHWPRMNRSQLMAVFPDGKTLHVPTDGKPLPGYNQALASYQSRKKSGGAISIASAERKGGFLSALFGGGADQAEEESGEVAVVASIGPDREATPSRRQPKAAVAERAEEPAPRGRAEEPAPRGREPRTAEPLPGVAGGEDAPVARTPPAAIEEPQPADTPETIIAALPARAVPLPLTAPRPKVDVGPSDVGATDVGALALAAEPAVGEAVAAAASAPEQAAANVPLPSRRPDYTPDTVAVASVDLPDSAPLAALAARETPGEGAQAIAGIIADGPAVPLPGGRPSVQTAAYDLAALPQARPAVATAQDALAAMPGGKGGRVAAPASPRTAMLAGVAPDSGAKTTAKARRPSLRDSKPEPKPVVVPAEPDAARWAFHKDYVINAKRETTAPSFAYNVVRTAPREVYTAGFQQEPAAGDPSRFSGKAVTFLSVARFNTN